MSEVQGHPQVHGHWSTYRTQQLLSLREGHTAHQQGEGTGRRLPSSTVNCHHTHGTLRARRLLRDQYWVLFRAGHRSTLPGTHPIFQTPRRKVGVRRKPHCSESGGSPLVTWVPGSAQVQLAGRPLWGERLWAVNLSAQHLTGVYEPTFGMSPASP